MSDVEQFSLITYDDEAEAGYLYLTSDFARSLEVSSYTEELNPEILLDFNHEDKLIGVEFLAPTSEKIKPFSGKSVFRRSKTLYEDGYSISFQVSEEIFIQGEIWVKDQSIVFLFEDEGCTQFVGMTIFPEMAEEAD